MELQDIVDEVSRILGEPVVLEDRDFTLVASGSHPDGPEGLDAVRQRSILHRRSTPEVQDWFERFGIAGEHPVRTPADAAFGVVARVCVPARWNGVTYGYLWVLDPDGRVTDADLDRVLRHAARAGTLMAGQARTREHLAERAHDLLVADPATAEQAAAEIDRLGALGRDRPVRAVVLAAAEPVNPWRLPPVAVPVTAEDHLVLLAPAAAAAEVAAAAHRLAGGGRPGPGDRPAPVVGIGGERGDLVGLRESVGEARIAVRVARTRGPAVACWDDLGPYRLLACGPRAALRDGLVDPAVRPLLGEHPVLTETAAVYLDLAGNAARTAEALAIHRQTLYYRLSRIAALTGLDLADGRDRLRLHLALTFRELTAGAAP